MIIRKPITNLEEWWLNRLPYVGASEVGIVCDVDGRFASKAMLFAEKKGLRPPTFDNARMRQGRMLEGACIEALCDRFPEWEVKRAKIWVVDDELRLACTPDAAAIRPGSDGIGNVQAKVIARNIYRQKWLDDPAGPITGPATPPAAYHLQTLAEMMLNDLSWGGLAVLINGEYETDFQWLEIERNEVLEDKIRSAVRSFFRDYLDAGVMPPLEPERDAELVKHLFPKDNGTTIDLAGDNRAMILAEDLVQTQAGLKRLRDSETAIKTELEAKLGEHTYGRLADGRCIAWKTQHRKAYAVEAADFRVLRILKTSPER